MTGGLMNKRVWHKKLVIRREMIKAVLQTTRIVEFYEFANNIIKVLAILYIGIVVTNQCQVQLVLFLFTDFL
jgi:hypothetical protein